MLGLKNLAMLSNYFDNVFVHLKQKARLRPDLSPKFSSTSGPKPARTRTRPEKPCPTYNSVLSMLQGAFRVVRQLAPQQGWFQDNGFRLKL